MGLLPAPGESFQGAVTTIEWIRVPWSERQLMGFIGTVTVYSSDVALGFAMTGGGHANWLVVVQGPTQAVVIPGCQVRLVSTCDEATFVNPEFLAVP